MEGTGTQFLAFDIAKLQGSFEIVIESIQLPGGGFDPAAQGDKAGVPGGVIFIQIEGVEVGGLDVEGFGAEVETAEKLIPPGPVGRKISERKWERRGLQNGGVRPTRHHRSGRPCGC
jgi:hypothetical protein